MKKFLLFIHLAFLALAVVAQTVTGVVYDDMNKDGKRETGEPGIKGVVVSDQVNVVVTDERGEYKIDNKGFGVIFISLPNGYGARSFWKNVSSTSVDFPVTREAMSKSFQFIHASDTHVSDASIERMNKFRQVVDSVKPNFVLITGDLVKDALRVNEPQATQLYELFARESQKISQPVWLVPGNHEIFGIERMSSLVSPQHPLYGRKMYRHYFGPDYYSFNYGGIHFVALNSVDFEDLWYFGRIDSLQVEWLKKDLAAIDRSTTVVTFEHIPFFSGAVTIGNYSETGLSRTLEREKGVLEFRHVVSNAGEVLAILNQYNHVLSLAGHDHARQLFRFEGIKTRFDQAAAVINSAYFPFVTPPSGVTLYKVNNGVIEEGKFIPLDK